MQPCVNSEGNYFEGDSSWLPEFVKQKELLAQTFFCVGPRILILARSVLFETYLDVAHIKRNKTKYDTIQCDICISTAFVTIHDNIFVWRHNNNNKDNGVRQISKHALKNRKQRKMGHVYSRELKILTQIVKKLLHNPPEYPTFLTM